ncbi:flagellar protein [Pectobacterium atrosepticum SCRI1043]|uniref:Flagellar protein n=1 Tax=Pectobacterium atrosepticum (strain SCRI 1043 / ATCC BAA-672) TaxID=218491 RepID=Q6D6G8_PECAS|nr:flagellar biosynthetic protein FliO [Pectobacterium atrosepticum]GKV84181.1 flagellar protein [Pectobacterium carotovorum subsp. carotovorum]AIA70565.1 flagellar assembly protein FliO [Pectobacterium atrosepticum]AIK14669.1 flagellar protein FliO [Pectobacterium atrosepticum]ATY91409.1 flagellar biosynthetic protein FliO [Pectobacterium atrosepticum]KFX17655.1 flagellar assembly protein FliO [Pectobacterium atrosepticum]
MATASVSSPTSVASQQSTLVTEPPLTGSMLLTQVGSVLAGILLFILLIAWLARKLGFAPQTKQNKLLKVVSSCPVGQRERVVIVEVDNTWLVLGVTAQQITPLHTLPAQPINDSSSTGDTKPVDFNQLLKKVLKRPEKSE